MNILDDFVKWIFAREIVNQCVFAELAMRGLRYALANGETTILFYSAHAFLVAVCNISKIL